MKEIHYLVGNSCNLNCDFCFWDKRLSSPDLRTTKNILMEIKNSHIRKVTLSGGEPTCSKQLFRVLKFFKENHIEVVLHTNGLLISKSFAKKIAMYVSRVSLSLDGSNIEMGKSMRKNPNYIDNTLKAVDIFLSLGVEVSVKTLITKLNCKDIINIGKLLENKRIKYWSLLEFNPINRGKIHKTKFYLTSKQFDQITKNVVDSYQTLKIRIRKLRSEPESYCFIATNGEVLIGDLNKEKLITLLKSINSYI